MFCISTQSSWAGEGELGGSFSVTHFIFPQQEERKDAGKNMQGDFLDSKEELRKT